MIPVLSPGLRPSGRDKRAPRPRRRHRGRRAGQSRGRRTGPCATARHEHRFAETPPGQRKRLGPPNGPCRRVDSSPDRPRRAHSVSARGAGSPEAFTKFLRSAAQVLAVGRLPSMTAAGSPVPPGSGGLRDPQAARRRAVRAPTEGTTTMDLRSTTFDLIYRDPVLRPLLVNYADCLESRHAADGVPPASCFVRLSWAVDGSTSRTPSCQLLAAEAHMPRHRGADDAYLAFVLRRLRTTLVSDAAEGLISARCLQASARARESCFDTVFTTSTFRIAPSPCQGRTVTLRDLAPWTGWADMDSADVLAPGGGTPRLN
jgi:hypothetical protein